MIDVYVNTDKNYMNALLANETLVSMYGADLKVQEDIEH
jgi:hypothetical protein